MSATLYDKYGGFRTASRVVMTFYDKVLDSDLIGVHFEAVDMHRLIDHQTRFISSILGGPAAFTDEHLRRVHAPLGLTDADYDEMSRLLAEALAEHGFTPADVAEVIAGIEARRGVIVCR